MQHEGQCPRMAHDFAPPVSLTAMVSIDLQIYDIGALVAAARERYVETNAAGASDLSAVTMDAKAVVPDLDVSAALRMLFEPVSLSGCDLLECDCELSSTAGHILESRRMSAAEETWIVVTGSIWDGQWRC